MSETKRSEARCNSVISLYEEAKKIAVEKLGTDDSSIIAACMAALSTFDLEDNLTDINSRLGQLDDAQKAFFNNFIAMEEGKKMKM